MQIGKRIIKSGVFLAIATYVSIALSGCSGSANGLISITPEQYLSSAKEQLETMDERNYEERDLDEIIRILENAEKNAKKSESIDKSRMYLCLVNTIKAKKQFQNALLRGEYVANRPEPFFTLDTKTVKETLRTAKKWLRLTNSTFKTTKLLADLNYIKGIYYTQKMLTQQSRERQESLDEAILSFRRCLGIAPAYKAEFRLFGTVQTEREVKLKLIECLAWGEMPAHAYGILSEFNFAPIMPVSGANEKYDYQWLHMKALVLATMGKYKEAAEILSRFKIVSPVDYPMVEDSIWLLEGVYKKLYALTKENKYDMEARVATSMLKKLGGIYSKESYSDASLLFPKLMAGDLEYNDAVMHFYDGRFSEAIKILNKFDKRSVITNANRVSAKLLKIEAMLYSGQQLTDDCIEDLLALVDNKHLNSIQKEKLGFLLARYVMDEDTNFNTTEVNHEGQSFVRSFIGKPWAIDLKHRRGQLKKEDKSSKSKNSLNSLSQDEDKAKEKEDNEPKREPGELIAEVFANKAEDWVVSANMHLVALPELNILNTTRVVGREDNGHWVFKDEAIDSIRRRKKYLVIFEYENSDGEKTTQGLLYN